MTQREDLAELVEMATLTVGGALTGIIGLCRATPTRPLHEALAALGEAEARLRFVAAVLRDPQATVPRDDPPPPPAPPPKRTRRAQGTTGGPQ